MFPFLSSKKSLALYFFFWLELSIVPATLLGPLSVPHIVLSATSCLAFAVATLPVWYLCKALPLRPGSHGKALVVHSVGLVFAALFFRITFDLLAELAAIAPTQGDLTHVVEERHEALLAVGGLFYFLVVLLHYVLLELETRRFAVEREGTLALAAQQAELQALRAQVHPHFLFNSLNTVSALIGYDPERARDACVLLGEYLRASLGAQQRPLVTLEEEWTLCEKYLTVEALRLGDRLQIEKHFETDTGKLLVPSLVLQPLIENAITHGVALTEDVTPLVIQASVQGDRLSLSLTNGHAGNARKGRRPGMGIENVRARLYGHYEKDASLVVERQETLFTARIDLPKLTAEGSPSSLKEGLR